MTRQRLRYEYLPERGQDEAYRVAVEVATTTREALTSEALMPLLLLGMIIMFFVTVVRGIKGEG